MGYNHPDATRCLVRGCEREGRYRASGGARRGYCERHKPAAQRLTEKRAKGFDWLTMFMEVNETRGTRS